MSTLETHHEKKIQEFDKEKRTIHLKYQELQRLYKTLEELEGLAKENKLTMGGYQTMTRVKENIKTLENTVENIKNDTYITQYLLKTGQIVYDYFEQIKRRRPDDERVRDVMQFFKKNAENLDKKQFQRGDLFDIYLSVIDPLHIQKREMSSETELCPNCKKPKHLDRTEAKSICPFCGLFENETLDSEKPVYHKDQPQELSYFAYKRINHFNEILNQLQAKENTEIPQEVYDTIVSEMAKERRYNLAELDVKTVKGYFKKYKHRGYSKYYEHIPHIINRLNGVPPKKLTPVMEENLRTLFKKIQGPFEKHCPGDRSNFLSYHYVLYKLCELLSYDDFLDSFNLLKSRNKLQDQEQIWKKICADLGFQFIATL